MKTSFVVGITGCSGSGKSFVLKSILSHFKKGEVAILSQDNYYIPRHLQPVDDNGIRNFDLPESIHLKDFQRDLIKIKKGEKLIREEYTYNNPGKSPSTIVTNSAPIVFVEGIFIFSHSFIDLELDYRIYIEASIEIGLERRLHRDLVERGYDAEDVNYRYKNHVIPTFRKYIEPHRDRADLIIDNNSTLPDLEELVNFLRTKSR